MNGGLPEDPLRVPRMRVAARSEAPGTATRDRSSARAAEASARSAGLSIHVRAQVARSPETSFDVRYSGISSRSARRFTRLMYFDLMNRRATHRSNALIL